MPPPTTGEQYVQVLPTAPPIRNAKDEDTVVMVHAAAHVNSPLRDGDGIVEGEQRTE